MHHAYVIEAGIEEGVTRALAWAREALGLETTGNPDIAVLRYSFFSVDDARGVQEIATTTPVHGESRVVIIAAARMYHESQNVLLKLFEEPPAGTYLILVIPSLGVLLPTLRSRVQVLGTVAGVRNAPEISIEALEFIQAASERRSAIVTKLAKGKDEDERRENRDRALAIVNGIEIAAARAGIERQAVLLREIQVLRDYLHDRSAPIKQILEHLAIVTPKGLV